MWFRSFRKPRELTFEEKFNQHDTGVFMTPDAPAMEAQKDHLVFIYDEMMKDRPEDAIISHLIISSMGPGLALVSVETYVNKTTGKVIAFPAHNGSRPIWSDKKGSYSAPIRGHLFLMKSNSIFELDSIYGNNVYYRRSQETCEAWNNKVKNKPYLEIAWIYLGIPERWDIDGGYEWEPLKINHRNHFTEEDHYYYSSRGLPLVRS